MNQSHFHNRDEKTDGLTENKRDSNTKFLKKMIEWIVRIPCITALNYDLLEIEACTHHWLKTALE